MFNLEYIRHAQTFFALQVPVYYYVRTKGSLASQALSISKTVRMKLTVFEYYNQFYKAVLDEEEYEKSRLKVYRFLFDAAQDGAALPLPGSTRLGEERTHVHAGALEGRGLLYDLFRERKLLDYCLEPAALKSGLSLRDAGLLLCLRQAGGGGRRELAALTGLSKGALTMALKRLSGRGLLSVEEVRDPGRREKRLHIAFPAAAGPVLADLESALRDFEAARLSGFTPEERDRYEALTGRIQDNIRSILQ